MRLKDQVAIVTGGGGGVGEGICLCLAKAGAHVTVSDIKGEAAEKVAAKIKEMGQKSLVVQTDVRLSDQCQELIETTLNRMGRIDILVCGHGVFGLELWRDPDKPPFVENVSEEDWDLAVDTNLKGVFFCNRAIVPYFKQEKRGKIINISSSAGRRGGDFAPHYCASKAGVIVLTQAIALQLAPYHVNVNTICPGPVRTPLYDTALSLLSRSHPQFKGLSPDEIFNFMVESRVALKRPQTPEAIGNAVVFLASSEADEITGQAINVDGGIHFS